jgi:hypothetical protein
MTLSIAYTKFFFDGQLMRKKLLVILVVLVSCLVLSCGAGLVWVKVFGSRDFVASGLPDPDSAFMTGIEYGLDVYVWECYNVKHIAVFRYSGYSSLTIWQRQESACGQFTDIEKQTDGTFSRRPTNPKLFWKMNP